MTRRWKRVAAGLTMFLVAVLALGGPDAAIANDSEQKNLVGTWEGTFKMQSGGVSIEMVLRLEGGKIAGELKTPHGPWTVTDAKYVEGKWEILVRTSENGAGRLKGVLSGDKLEGNYEFPPMFGGAFTMTRTKSGK